jgi:hypothetical protein
MRKALALCLLLLLAFVAGSTRAQALSGAVNFVVLEVTFSDFASGSRFTSAQTQANFANIAKLWGTETSYGNITLNYQFAGPYQVASPSTTYIDVGGNSSSNAAILQLLKDAVAASPSTINWTNVYGVVVLFSDPRSTGFYRGITYPSAVSISPPGGAACGSCNVHVSIVGENPTEDVARTWGRWAHETGHQMQANPGNPWHPSNYNSDFEQMDGEYPAQSGVFNKQSNIAYPNWLPATKYKTVKPPSGAAVGLYAEERPPGSQPDFQAIKAFLTFGGSKVYYLVSVRHHILGDDAATTHGPNGLPDEGVLIERVVEGGDPTILDGTAPNQIARWVNVENNGATADTLWHAGNTYHSASDGIYIDVQKKADEDHYQVLIRYAENASQPDVGINSWLEPPGNTYETTDIWVDSPVNNYGTYRYPQWSDLLGGTVPSGNGDDPAINQVNRLYARVRNYGSKPAANVVVHFDITNPPGVGINGANGFIPLGTVTSAQFPGLALIPAGGTVDVYYNWTPNFTLTPAQIQQGIFYFHTCIRVRLDHVTGETFFANQDGDGQQENIDYFQATSNGAPGAPGPPNAGTIRIRNDSPASPKQFALSVLRDTLPLSWEAVVNGGNPIVNLAPGEVRDIPVTVKQTQPEPVGSHHTFKVFASSQVTLRNALRPTDLHNDFKQLGGVQLQVAVLRKTKLVCKSTGKGVVTGELTGLTGKEERRVPIEVVGVSSHGRSVALSRTIAYGYVPPAGGAFTTRFSTQTGARPKSAVCLFAGTTQSTSAGSAVFPM